FNRLMTNLDAFPLSTGECGEEMQRCDCARFSCPGRFSEIGHDPARSAELAHKRHTRVYARATQGCVRGPDSKCAWSPSPFLLNGYGYQYEWSNLSGGCVQSR